MKKVEKVSIAEIAFTLDSDAYAALKQYLDELHGYYAGDPDGREIIADIEARIAELILEQQVYTKVVSLPLIDTIIAQLGTPDQIDDEVGDESRASEGATGSGGVGGAGATGGMSGGVGGVGGVGGGGFSDGSIPRRLHRSEEGKIFGGVCSGIARYFDISVAWVRLAFLFPVIASVVASPFHWWLTKSITGGWAWAFFVVYVVLWIALPMARTPRQKLEARGEKITPESIRQNLQGSVSTPAGKKAASVAAELVNVLGRIVLVFVKIVVAIVGFSFLLAAISMFMAMMAVLFHPATAISTNGMDVVALFEGMRTPVLFVMLGIFSAMMPLFVVAMALLSFTFSWRLGRVFYGLTLGSWGLAIVSFGVIATSEAQFIRDELPDRIHQWDRHSDWDDWHYHIDRAGDVRDRIEEDAAAAPDAVQYDASRDSLVIIVRSDGSPNDTVVVSSRASRGASEASEASGVVPEAPAPPSLPSPPSDGRVEIRRTE